MEVPRRLLSAIQHHSFTRRANEPVNAVLKETTILMKGSRDANAARRWGGAIMAVLLGTVIVGLSSDAGAASSPGSGGVASGSVASISTPFLTSSFGMHRSMAPFLLVRMRCRSSVLTRFSSLTGIIRTMPIATAVWAFSMSDFLGTFARDASSIRTSGSE